ncbi:helix-turn-helix domain-containing protein [Microbacterium sediminicola]|uniref:Helix-turn-helix domain-containing protein n=1 Tax=Microbacterium sediminicola TaxID=415210 RepID=A0ABN2IJN9_9MICO
MARAYNVLAPTCPSSRLLHRIGARWTIFILAVLSDGPARFSVLRESIPGITSKVLTESLRSLERDGLIERAEIDTVPDGAEYAMAPLGWSPWGPLNGGREWAETHVPDIEAAQARADVGDVA